MATPSASRLLREERRRTILELLKANGRVTLPELLKRFGVSAVTVRADLAALAVNGLLERSHGGAVQPLDPIQDFPLKLKATLHHAEKARIGQAAAELVQPNQTILLDSGTTTAEVARQLKRQKIAPLTVITNSLNIGFELADAPNLTVIMIGGIMRQVSHSFVGPQAEQMLRDLHADHLFLGVDGFSPEAGPSTPDILEAQLNGLMMRVSEVVTVVADSSKFGQRSLSVIGPIEAVHRIITDTGIAPEMAESLRQRGIEVLTV